MNGRIIAMTLAALVVGAAAGYFAGLGSGTEETEPRTAERRMKKPIEDAGASASLDALRKRISELEKLLAEKNAETEKTRAGSVADGRQPQERRESHRERMERMQKEDPARYTQITNRIATWRRRRAETARSKIDFLSSIDVSGMSVEARKVHEELQELVARREEIEAELHREGISDEERHRLFGELRDTWGKFNELNAKERDNLLAETARNLGFEGDDAAEIVTTVKEVVEATESGWGRGHGRGHGRASGRRR